MYTSTNNTAIETGEIKGSSNMRQKKRKKKRTISLTFPFLLSLLGRRTAEADVEPAVQYGQCWRIRRLLYFARMKNQPTSPQAYEGERRPLCVLVFVCLLSSSLFSISLGLPSYSSSRADRCLFALLPREILHIIDQYLVTQTVAEAIQKHAQMVRSPLDPSLLLHTFSSLLSPTFRSLALHSPFSLLALLSFRSPLSPLTSPFSQAEFRFSLMRKYRCTR